MSVDVSIIKISNSYNNAYRISQAMYKQSFSVSLTMIRIDGLKMKNFRKQQLLSMVMEPDSKKSMEERGKLLTKPQRISMDLIKLSNRKIPKKFIYHMKKPKSMPMTNHNDKTIFD